MGFLAGSLGESEKKILISPLEWNRLKHNAVNSLFYINIIISFPKE